MQEHEVLVRPIITEKATQLGERHHQVAFEVACGANKNQIRAAVTAAYGVRVTGVRTLVVPGKLKRRGQSVGKRPSWKKAIVSLVEGETIDFFAAE